MTGEEAPPLAQTASHWNRSQRLHVDSTFRELMARKERKTPSALLDNLSQTNHRDRRRACPQERPSGTREFHPVNR